MCLNAWISMKVYFIVIIITLLLLWIFKLTHSNNYTHVSHWLVEIQTIEMYYPK